MKIINLYNKDSKGKVRTTQLSVSKNGDEYTISRKSGILNGKMVDAPDIVIDHGKAKRTIKEQAELKFASIFKEQRDKGYKLLSDLTNEEIKYDDYDAISALLLDVKTDANGFNKPMLASDSNKKVDKTIFDREFLISRKLDGVRTMAHFDGAKLIFKSRTGKLYKSVSKHFECDQELIEIAKKYNCELDGEFYIHGKPLKYINGVCQLKDYDPERQDEIEFHLFDLAETTMTAKERCDILNELECSNPRVEILHHYLIYDYEQLMKFHNQWVGEGYEGAMGRYPEALYEFGKRSSGIWKFKMFQDDEFVITGISDGLRPEDMCFTLITKDKKQFKAKPIGTAAEKLEYIRDIDNIVGKKGCVKFQYLTEDGIPFLPCFKYIRDNE